MAAAAVSAAAAVVVSAAAAAVFQLLRLLLPLLLLLRLLLLLLLLLLEVGWPVKSHLSKWQPNRFTGRGPRQRPQRHEPRYDPPLAQWLQLADASATLLSAGGRLLGSARLGLWLGSARLGCLSPASVML